MDDLFFLSPLCLRCLKTLKELGESDDMDQFVGKDINQKRQERQIVVPLESPENKVILKADKIEIARLAPGFKILKRSYALAQYGQRKAADLFSVQRAKGLDIIAIPLRLPDRCLEEITRCIFCNVEGIADGNNLILPEKDHF